jgi:phosphoribosylglycinamide formyltransferase 1
MLKIGVMVSGGGTNLQAILDAIENGTLADCRVVTVVSSRPDAGALARAGNAGISSAVFSRSEYPDPYARDAGILSHMLLHGVQLVVLAGFLSLIGNRLISAYPQAILNVHPSLIPSFCGKGFYGIIPHRKALEYGVKVTGATVHFVDPEYDSGPIVLQKAVAVLEGDTPETLQRRVMEEAEWKLLPEAIRLYAAGKLQVNGRHVTVLP